MNEEGVIYRESFHLIWAKIMGFPGAKKSQKLLFRKSSCAKRFRSCVWRFL